MFLRKTSCTRRVCSRAIIRPFRVSGRGIDQVGASVAPTHRAICCLRAITGNVDRQGACVLAEGSDFVPEVDLELTLEHADALEALSLNTGVTPLQSYDGYARVARLQSGSGASSLRATLRCAHPDLVLRAMETGAPYRVSALIVEATNPLLTYADTHRVYDALMKLDLIVVLDYYLTPTASIADDAASLGGLPSSARRSRRTAALPTSPTAARKRWNRITSVRTITIIFRELGLRMGQEGQWPDETFEDAIASTLAPSGMDWDTYCELGLCFQPPAYAKHLALDEEGRQRLRHHHGQDRAGKRDPHRTRLSRLPEPGEPRRLCSRAFIAEREAQGWVHMPLITGARKQPYNASMYLNNEEFRKRDPFPVVEMSEATAESLGLAKGDCVVISTDKGEARFKLDTIRMRDGLINADYGWWHPEWIDRAPFDGGMWESNVNCLTSCSLDESEPMIGTWSYNAIDCMIRKDDGDLSWQVGFSA